MAPLIDCELREMRRRLLETKRNRFRRALKTVVFGVLFSWGAVAVLLLGSLYLLYAAFR